MRIFVIEKFFIYLFYLLSRYIDNVYKKLNHLQTLSKKANEKSGELEKKRINLLTELSIVGPETTTLIQRTKSLQKRVSCFLFLF